MSVTSTRRTRVLVVDDERHISRLLEFVLAKQGYQVKVANSGEQALATVDDFAPDVVLLDLVMPGISGLDVLKQLRSDGKHSDLKILVLSAHAFEHLPEELKGAGASHLGNKPIAPSSLLKMLVDWGLPQYIPNSSPTGD
jgi:CheY-like chemotaxis protein